MTNRPRNCAEPSCLLQIPLWKPCAGTLASGVHAVRPWRNVKYKARLRSPRFSSPRGNPTQSKPMLTSFLRRRFPPDREDAGERHTFPAETANSQVATCVPEMPPGFPMIATRGPVPLWPQPIRKGSYRGPALVPTPFVSGPPPKVAIPGDGEAPLLLWAPGFGSWAELGRIPAPDFSRISCSFRLYDFPPVALLWPGSFASDWPFTGSRALSIG